MKDFESKVYDFFGIKKFRKLVFKSRDFLFGKKENFEYDPNYMDNYNLGKVNSLEDLIYYKKWVYINMLIHTFPVVAILLIFMAGSISIPAFIILSLLNVINAYCVMLQRYNLKRINRVISKMKPKYDIQKEEELSIIDERVKTIEKNNCEVLINNKIIDTKEYSNDRLFKLQDIKSSLGLLQLYLKDNELNDNKVLYSYDYTMTLKRK